MGPRPGMSDGWARMGSWLTEDGRVTALRGRAADYQPVLVADYQPVRAAACPPALAGVSPRGRAAD